MSGEIDVSAILNDARLGWRAIVIAVLGRLAGPAPVEQGIATMQRDLVFADRADGAIVITEPGRSEPVSVVTGQAGFMRGILRALARERRLDRLGHDVPFRLSAWRDGRLTLDDPADGGRIELEAFGPDNAAVFARLLSAKGNAP